MKALKKASQAGTLESCDIMILLAPVAEGEGISISLESPTKRQFGARIREIILQALKNAGISDAKVTANDRGALDCTISARMETAISRATEEA